MKDKIKEATSTGDVKVVQGDTTLRSKVLVAFYDNATPAQPGGSAPSGAAAKSTSIPSSTPDPQ